MHDGDGRRRRRTPPDGRRPEATTTRTASPTTRRRPSSRWSPTRCPGEDLQTPYLEDAQLWLGVYTELLEFKERLLRDTSHALEHHLAAPVARRSARRTR